MHAVHLCREYENMREHEHLRGHSDQLSREIGVLHCTCTKDWCYVFRSPCT